MGANLAKEKLSEGTVGVNLLKVQTQEVGCLLFSQLCKNQGQLVLIWQKCHHQKVQLVLIYQNCNSMNNKRI